MQQENIAKTVTYWEKLGKLNILTGITAAQQLRWEAKQQQKNREAEEAYTRKTVWGQDSNNEDEMGDNIYLGDVQIDNKELQKSNTFKNITSLGLAVAGIGVGVSAPIAVWNLTSDKSLDKSVEVSTETDPVGYEISIFRDE